MGKAHLTEQDIASLKELYESGLTSGEICKRFRIHYTTLQRLAKIGIIKLRGNGLSKDIQDEILKRYQEGESSPKIAKALNIAKPSVLRALKRRGIVRRTNSDYPRRKKPPASKEELYDLYAVKQTRIKDLVKKYNRNRTTIRNWLRYYDIPIRSNGEELKLIPCHEHSCWRGGLSTLAEILFGRLKEWKMKIRERDGWRCTRCGEGSNLEVHHTKPLRNLIAEFHQSFPDINLTKPEDLEFAARTIVAMHSPEIGTCLCKKCHEEIDPHRRAFKSK